MLPQRRQRCFTGSANLSGKWAVYRPQWSVGATTPTGNKGAARLCSRQTKRKTTAAGERRGSWSRSAAQTWRCLEDGGPKSCSSTVSSAHNDLHVQQRGCGFSADVTLFCVLLASVCSKYNTHTHSQQVYLCLFSASITSNNLPTIFSL